MYFPHRLAPVLICAQAMISTTAGGMLAFRLRGRMALLLGFAAGVVIGVVSFDLLPEIISHASVSGANPRFVMLALTAGFFLFHVMEKLILIHHHDECAPHGHKHPHVGILSALALSAHSFMDGAGIGFGFRVSWRVGLVVGLAVVTHDFVDGMNTVILMLGNRNSVRRAIPFLALDALAPIAGLACAFFVQPSPVTLVLYLGFFAGFLLYMGASHILPEAHRETSSIETLALTLLGALLALGVSVVI